MSKATKQMPEEPRKFLEQYPDTQQLELLQPDMLGILRGKRVGRDEFAKPFTDGLNFCGATVLLDAKGLTFDRIDNGGRDGDPDAISTAVPGSLAPVPWAHVPTAQVLLVMNDSKGGPFFADPRQVLRHAMKPLQDMGLTAVAATELEFYLIQESRSRQFSNCQHGRKPDNQNLLRPEMQPYYQQHQWGQRRSASRYRDRR
jgi:glutamine synthetase